MRVRVLCSVASLCLVSTALAAQTASGVRTKGFSLGIGAEANNIVAMPGVPSTLNPSPGGGVTLGYGITERWTAYVHAGISTYLNTGGGRDWAGSTDIGARYYLLNSTSRVRPFGSLGLVSRMIASDAVINGTVNRLMSSQLTPGLGAGAEARLGAGTSLTLSALYTRAQGTVPKPMLQAGFTFRPGHW